MPHLNPSATILAAGVLLLAATASGQGTFDLHRGPTRELVHDRSWDQAKFDLLVITLDAFKTSMIGATDGPFVGTTPTLDAFKKSALRFNNAFAVTMNRRIGVASLLLSRYPSSLVGVDVPRLPNLATQFSDRGFKPYGFFRPDVTALDAEPISDLGKLGFDRVMSRGTNVDSFDKMFNRCVTQRQTGQQLCGWANISYCWPPSTYHPGIDARSGTGHFIAATRFADASVGRILNLLDESGLTETTIVCITTAYGGTAAPRLSKEVSREMSDATLRVPLFIRIPGIPPRDIESTVETVDILPSMLETLQLKIDYSIQGRSFLDLIAGQKRPEELAFAEYQPQRGESRSLAVISVRDERFRFTMGLRSRTSRLVMHEDPSRDVAEDYPEAASRLIAAAESYAIYNESSTAIVLANEQTILEPSVAGSLKTRTGWLVRNNRPNALASVRKLAAGPADGHLDAATYLYELGTPEDLSLVRSLLANEDWQVQGLVGAFLLKHGDESGLDYVLRALRNDFDPQKTQVAFDALARSETPAAIAAVKNLVPVTRTARAFHTLALFKHGDPSAAAKLPEILLGSGEFDRGPFVRAIAGIGDKRARTVLAIALTAVTTDDRIAILIMDELDRLNAWPQAESVAAMLNYNDHDVRKRAEDLLIAWKSPIGIQESLQPLRQREPSTADIIRALQIPGLIGSPALPGVRFDNWSAIGTQPLQVSDRGLPIFDKNSHRIVIPEGQAGITRAFFVFRASDEDVAVPLTIRVQSVTNEMRLRSVFIKRHGPYFIWYGTIPEPGLELGDNLLTLRVEDREKMHIRYEPVAFFSVPKHTPPIAASLELGRDEKPARLTSPFNLDSTNWTLWGHASTKGTFTVKFGSEVLLELPVSSGRIHKSLRVPQDLKRRRNERVTLTFVPDDNRAAFGTSALIYGSTIKVAK